MIRFRQALVVEGKYDKIKLQSLVDAPIIQTNGFRIYRDRETLDLLRTLAERTGLIILTDSDTAGFQIRRYLTGAISKGTIYHAYIPDVPGKEKRKEKPSREGTLGVEGISATVLLQALERAGVPLAKDMPPRRPVTKLDFYEDGLTGCAQSAQRREVLKRLLNLPAHLSTNALLTVLNAVYSYEEYRQLIDRL